MRERFSQTQLEIDSEVLDPPGCFDICKRVQAWADKDPGAISVVDDEGSLTRGEFMKWVDELAHQVKKSISHAGSRVAILTERDRTYPVAMLATMKAGATAVWLDPSKRSSHQELCASTKVELVLGPKSQSVPGIAHLNAAVAPPIETRSIPLSENVQAYVMFTSGSMAKPKQVDIGSETLVRYLAALNSVLELQPQDVYLHSAAQSFSSSIRQVLLPLISGSRLVIASTQTLSSPILLTEIAKTLNVSVLDFVPSYWKRIVTVLENRGSALPSQLRFALSASEPLSSRLANQILPLLPEHANLVAMYGQTETAGIVAARKVAREDILACDAPVSPGRALPMSKIVIVDRAGQLVEPGMSGEIVVVGRGGTSSLPDGTQSHHTGDCGYLDADGCLIVEGRLNDQLTKIRGLRVDLTQVEAILEAHPAFESAAVVIVADRNDDKTLVAHLVPSGRGNAEEAFAEQSEFLPAAAVSMRSIIHSQLPVLAAGKPDRQRLIELSVLQPVLDADPTDHDNDIASAVLDVWRAIFANDSIGLDDDFFALGGHSLMAVDILIDIDEKLGVLLPWQTMVDAPTPKTLAAVIAAARTESSS